MQPNSTHVLRRGPDLSFSGPRRFNDEDRADEAHETEVLGDLLPASESDSPFNQAAGKERLRILHTVACELSGPQLRLYCLIYEDEASHAAAANVLGITIQAESQLHGRLIAQITRRLAEKGITERRQL